MKFEFRKRLQEAVRNTQLDSWFVVHSVAAILVLLAFATTVTGCQASAAVESRQPLNFVLAFDTSGSYANKLADSCDAAGYLSRFINPKADRLQVFSFDTGVRELSSDVYLAGTHFNDELFNLLTLSEEEGTDFVALLGRLNRAANQSPDTRSLIFVFTDGAPDGPFDQSKGIAEGLQALSVNPNVARVLFLGVEPGFRERWRDDFESLGDKLFMGGLNEIEIVKAQIEQLRTD